MLGHWIDIAGVKQMENEKLPSSQKARTMYEVLGYRAHEVRVCTVGKGARRTRNKACPFTLSVGKLDSIDRFWLRLHSPVMDWSDVVFPVV